MKEIKFKGELEKLFRDYLYEDWMSEEDYQELLALVFEKLNTSWEQLSAEIQVGIDNGYSLADQLAILTKILQQ